LEIPLAQRRANLRAARREAPTQRVRLSEVCTPGMGVNLWGASSLYVNSAHVVIR